MNSGENEAPFDAKGRRIGILVVAYNAASVIQETLHRIPADVWAAYEELVALGYDQRLIS